MSLRNIIYATLIDIRVLVDYGYRVVNGVVVQLSLVINQFQLHLGGFLD